MAKFYDNMPKVPDSGMTSFDYTERKLVRDRAMENALRNNKSAPHLAETFFGHAHSSKSFSIEVERQNARILTDARVRELSKHRKISSASEKFKFF